MLMKAFRRSSTTALVECQSVQFSYDYSEIKRLELKVKRKLQVLRTFTELKQYDYEAPNMSYDKKSGEIRIDTSKQEKDVADKLKKKKSIKSMDDMIREKKALFDELGLDDEGKPKNPKESTEKVSESIKQAQDRMIQDFDLDPSAFHVFSRDFMRVDVGLLIQRPPIFMTMRDRDMTFLKYKNDIMNEYYCNTKQFSDEFEEVSKLNEDILGDNPYSSKMNLDNYPTHRSKENGEEYCAASKHFSKVDPTIEDPRSLHYAGEDRTYMIVRNKYTAEWEFPTHKMNFGQTFIRAKQNLFNILAHDGQNESDSSTLWKVKYFGQSPVVATIREFTEEEKKDKNNLQLKGVRTYFFQAHHWRGLPTLSEHSAHDYDDFAWVPKRKLNEYFARDYYEIFVKACLTR